MSNDIKLPLWTLWGNQLGWIIAGVSGCFFFMSPLVAYLLAVAGWAWLNFSRTREQHLKIMKLYDEKHKEQDDAFMYRLMLIQNGCAKQLYDYEDKLKGSQNGKSENESN